MPCMHGLDDNNCPICRMTKATVPRNPINKDAAKNVNLRPENPFFMKHLSNKNGTKDYLTKSNEFLKPNIINPTPLPNLINPIPNFESNEFMKKLDELDGDGWDSYGVSKKIKLENPDLKLDDD